MMPSPGRILQQPQLGVSWGHAWGMDVEGGRICFLTAWKRNTWCVGIHKHTHTLIFHPGDLSRISSKHLCNKPLTSLRWGVSPWESHGRVVNSWEALPGNTHFFLQIGPENILLTSDSSPHTPEPCLSDQKTDNFWWPSENLTGNWMSKEAPGSQSRWSLCNQLSCWCSSDTYKTSDKLTGKFSLFTLFNCLLNHA